MLGDRIRKFRREKGFTVKVMSDIIGISQGTLSDIENGKTVPSGDTISSIVRNTDINSGWLLTGEGPMEKDTLHVAEGQVGYGGQVRMDTDLLKAILEEVERSLAEEGRALSPDKKAELVSFVYEELSEDEGKRRDMKIRISKLVRLAS